MKAKFLSLMLMLARGLAFVSLLTSCNGNKPNYKPYDARALVPQHFLFTKNSQLNNWLDTPVQVQYDRASISEILNSPALRDLNCEIISLPDPQPEITMAPVAITRRQLLWALAQDHKLTMLAVTRKSTPSYISIKARPRY